MLSKFPYMKLPAGTGTTSVSEDDDDEVLRGGKTTSSSAWIRYLTGATFLLAIIAATSLVFHAATTATTSSAVLDCGSTPDEARAKGCQFETHHLCWVPAPCYDAELSALWHHYFTEFFADTDGRTVYDLETVTRGDLPFVYVYNLQHYAHCSFTWMKFQRAVQFGWPLDNFTGNYHHKAHCAEMVLNYDEDPIPGKNISSVLARKYATCAVDWKSSAMKKVWKVVQLNREGLMKLGQQLGDGGV